MRWLLTTVCFLASLTPALAEDRLPSRPIDVPLAAVPTHGPWSFDLIDLREEMRLARLLPHVDVDPHTFFVVKHHLGVAGGYDNGIAHGSVGYYLTVAEWGRWNFGVPSIEIGLGRYPMIDRSSKLTAHSSKLYHFPATILFLTLKHKSHEISISKKKCFVVGFSVGSSRFISQYDHQQQRKKKNRKMQ